MDWVSSSELLMVLPAWRIGLGQLKHEPELTEMPIIVIIVA